MNWQDKGYLISHNKYNENSSIAEFYTENYGKTSGIIFGSSSKKIKNYFLIGNKFHINYNSKNETRVGNFKIEIEKINTPYFMDNEKNKLIELGKDTTKKQEQIDEAINLSKEFLSAGFKNITL